MTTTWRRITRDEAKQLEAGSRVAIRYFDPHGPNRDRGTNMTTDPGVVVAVTGDPATTAERTVIVRPDDPTCLTLDHFGTDLYVPNPEEEA
jgi:hypothetical protein